MPYTINAAAKTFSFPAFTSSDSNCVSLFDYVVKWKGGSALATSVSGSDYIYRSVQGTNDRTVSAYSASSGDAGTVVLTIECTN